MGKYTSARQREWEALEKEIDKRLGHVDTVIANAGACLDIALFKDRRHM